MYIRVTPGSMQPGKVREANAVIEELFALYRQAGGFQRGYLGADERTGEGMVVTLWDSEAAALAAIEQYRTITAKLGPLMATGQAPVPPRAYEVLLHSEG